MIELSHVSLALGGLPVLNDISFRVEKGQIVALRGPSGIGKTTILRLVAGELRPDAGEVRVNGERVGYVFQEPRLLPWRTALENVALVLLAKGLPKREALAVARGWLERMGLAGFADYYPAQLSGGMAQRVALARAFAIEPDVLLFDEPLTNLDQRLKTSLLDLVGQIASERRLTVLYVTHDLLEALRIADRILELRLEEGGVHELDLSNRRALVESLITATLGEGGAGAK